MSNTATRQTALADLADVERIVECLVSAYADHDTESLRSLYAEDVVIRVGELEYHGRDGAARFWDDWFTAFPDVSSRIERQFIDPGRFVLDWTETGTHTRRLRMGDLEVPARGRQLSWRGVSIYELVGSEIATVDYFVDRLRAAEQLVGPVAAVLAIWARLTRLATRLRGLQERSSIRLLSPRA